MKKITYKTDIIALKKLMIENHIEKITQLSGITNINRNTLGQILNGNVQPSAEVMYRLINCLNMSPKQAGEIFFSSNLHNKEEK